MQILTETLH